MENCPWLAFAQQIDPHPFCEERLCAWVVEPANTWTNIGYLIAAILIWRSTKGSKETKKLFTRATLFLFFGSTLFHATGTVFGKLIDVSAMFVLSVGVLTLSLRRLFNFNPRQTELLYFGLLIPSLAFLFILKIGNILFITQIGAVVAVEIYLLLKGSTHLDKKNFILAAIALLAAFAFWNFDINGQLCDPSNHVLTAHGVWHLLNALAIYFLYRAFS